MQLLFTSLPLSRGLCRCRFICNTFASKDQQTPGALSGLAFGQLGFDLHIRTSLGNKAWLPCGNQGLRPLREGSPGFIHRERRDGPSVFWKLALGSLLPWETLGCWVSGELFLLMVASSGGYSLFLSFFFTKVRALVRYSHTPHNSPI